MRVWALHINAVRLSRPGLWAASPCSISTAETPRPVYPAPRGGSEGSCTGSLCWRWPAAHRCRPHRWNTHINTTHVHRAGLDTKPHPGDQRYEFTKRSGCAFLSPWVSYDEFSIVCTDFFSVMTFVILYFLFIKGLLMHISHKPQKH